MSTGALDEALENVSYFYDREVKEGIARLQGLIDSESDKAKSANARLVGLSGDIFADYIDWRKGLGTLYTQSHYDIWRANFGASLGSSSGSALPSADPLSAAVPEPASTILAFGALAVLACCRSRCRTA